VLVWAQGECPQAATWVLAQWQLATWPVMRRQAIRRPVMLRPAVLRPVALWRAVMPGMLPRPAAVGEQFRRNPRAQESKSRRAGIARAQLLVVAAET
jgi:hypothetical protein